MRLLYVVFLIIPILSGTRASIPATFSVAIAEEQTNPNCPNLSIDFTGLDTFYCLESNFDFPLSATVINGSGGMLTWSGPGVTGSTFNPSVAGLGTHWIRLSYEEAGPCFAVDSIQFNIYEVLTFNGIVADPREICAGDTSILRYTGNLPPGTSYNWTFDGGTPESNTDTSAVTVRYNTPGLYPVDLEVTGPGCNQPIMIDPGRARVSEPIDSAHLTCGDPTLNIVTFTWSNLPDVVAYRYSLDGADPVFTSDTFLEVPGLLPSDSAILVLTPLGSSACGNGPTETLICRTLPCPVFSIDFSDVPTLICLDSSMAPVPLLPMVMGGSGVNSSQQWSGPGVVNDTFFPALAGPGQHYLVLDYQEKGPCGIIDSTLVEVYRVEAGIFTLAPNQVCFGDTATVAYVGDAADNALFEWDFGGLDTIGDDLRGDIGLLFPNPGTFPLELTITELGCRSFATTLIDSILVVEPLPDVNLRCGPVTRNELTIEWDDNPRADGYLLQISGQGPVAQTNNFYEFTGLDPGEERTLIVTPLGQFPCGDGPPDTLTCATMLCPQISLDFSGIDTSICNYPGAPLVPLLAVPVGGNGEEASMTWSGPGVVGNSFDPNLAGVGLHRIDLIYREIGPCMATDSLFIRVHAIPQTSVAVITREICQTDSTVVLFNGSAGPSATFDWDFGGGNVLFGSGGGPYTLGFDAAGTYHINVAVSENGCLNEGGPAQDSIRVFAPLGKVEVSCEASSLTTVSFSWLDLPGAEVYRVENLTNFEIQDQTNNEVTIAGLVPGQEVDLSVTSLAVNLCGNGGSDTLTCNTLPCPPANFNYADFQHEFCFGTSPDSILLPFGVDGALPEGRMIWEGPGVRFDGTNYWFSPLFAGAGSFVLTSTYFLQDPLDFTGARLCTIDSNVVMQVFPQPIANAGPDQTITCLNDRVELDGSNSSTTGNVSLLWTSSNSDVIIANPDDPTITVDTSGTYTLTVTSGQGCVASDVVNVIIATTPPVPELEIFDLSCFGEQDGLISILSIEGGLSPYRILLDGAPVNGRSVGELGAGNYVLEIIDVNNCNTPSFITIVEPEPLTVRITSPDDLTAIPSGTEVDLEAEIFGGTTIDSIQWLPLGVGVASFNRLRLEVTEERTVEVNVVDESGCRASDRVNLSITQPDPLYVPTGFTPNGDNVNDVFFVGANIDLVESIDNLEIYDRWGNQVFRVQNFPPNDPRFGWDGTAGGQRLNPAVFVYQALVLLRSGERILVKGDIALIR